MQPSDSLEDRFLSLPADLLTEIASYVSLRPRVLVLSRLSKRWHACVFNSITSLRRLLPKFPLERLASLPAITTLSISGDFAEAVLPTTLQSLALYDTRFTPAPGHRLELLTSLICWPPRVPVDFVCKYATALKALHLMGARLDEGLVRHYPSLTFLSIHEVSSESEVTAQGPQVGTLLALHADQLTDLEVYFNSDGPSEAPALVHLLRPLPRLRTLDFYGYKGWMCLLAKLIPSDCKVSYSKQEDHLSKKVCPYVSELCVTHELPHKKLIRCTNLTTLDVSDDSVDLCALPASLRLLTLRDCPDLLTQDWAHLRSLQQLKAERLPPSLCTRHLRKLRLDWRPYIDSERGLLALTEVIGACPKLTKLGSTPMCPRDLRVDHLAQLARFAAARGVTKLSVRITYLMVSHTERDEDYTRVMLVLKALAHSLPWIKLRPHDKPE